MFRSFSYLLMCKKNSALSADQPDNVARALAALAVGALTLVDKELKQVPAPLLAALDAVVPRELPPPGTQTRHQYFIWVGWMGIESG